MRKHFALGMAALCLCLFMIVPAKADELFNEDDFYTPLFGDKLVGASATASSATAVYRLMNTNERESTGDIYCWSLSDSSYTLYAASIPIPTVNLETPVSQLTGEDRENLLNSVFYLLTDEAGTLYGLNPHAARVGVITGEGITWSDVTLDLSIINGTDSVYPPNAMNLFIRENTLFLFYDLSTVNGGEAYEPALLAIDLDSGECTVTPLPQTVGLCWYQEGAVLLMQRENDQELCFQVYQLKTGESTRLEATVPIALSDSVYEAEGYSKGDWFFSSITGAVGGLTWDAERDVIYVVDSTHLWASVDGASFATIARAEWDYLNSYYSNGQVLETGQYLYANQYLMDGAAQ